MLQLEVLIYVEPVQETVRIDVSRQATDLRTSRRRWTFHRFRCLSISRICRCPSRRSERGKLTLGEVTTLQHEVGDHTMERTSFVSESVLAGCELTEVFGRLGDGFVEQPEDDTTGGLIVDSDIELVIGRGIRM